jgi:hypothetical protein
VWKGFLVAHAALTVQEAGKRITSRQSAHPVNQRCIHGCPRIEELIADTAGGSHRPSPGSRVMKIRPFEDERLGQLPLAKYWWTFALAFPYSEHRRGDPLANIGHSARKCQIDFTLIPRGVFPRSIYWAAQPWSKDRSPVPTMRLPIACLMPSAG